MDNYNGAFAIYKLVINVNGITVLTKTNSTVGKHSLGTVLRLFTTNNTCRAKLYYNGPIHQIYIYAPGALENLNNITYTVFIDNSFYT